MTAVIIEDESLSAERLERLLRKIDPTIKILGVLDSVRDSVMWFSENDMPNILFCDIELGDGVSFEIFKQIKITCPIIFTTAYNQYAIDAFKVNSIDYLLKPFDAGDIQRAFEKLKQLKENAGAPDQDALQTVIQKLTLPQYRTRFMVKIGEHLNSIGTDDISFLFGENKIVWAYLKSGKKYVLNYTLDQLEEMLNPEFFFRVNRQFIVALDSIKDAISYSNARLKIILHNSPFKEDIIMSREKVTDFKNWLGK